jgi:hypothetical protein
MKLDVDVGRKPLVRVANSSRVSSDCSLVFVSLIFLYFGAHVRRATFQAVSGFERDRRVTGVRL